jgi:hypothetical protein
VQSSALYAWNHFGGEDLTMRSLGVQTRFPLTGQIVYDRFQQCPFVRPRTYFCPGLPLFSLVGGTIPFSRMYVTIFP